jgi:hypothetical protein
MTTSYHAPPTVALAKIEAHLVENLEAYHFESTRISTALVLALTRYALAHGAVTVGDLEEPVVRA